MNCPKCRSNQVIVIDSTKYTNRVKRRRECLTCGFRFNTIETIGERKNKNEKI